MIRLYINSELCDFTIEEIREALKEKYPEKFI